MPDRQITGIDEEVELRSEAHGSDAMGLAAVRRAFDLTQTALAGCLGVSQANVAKIERRSDLLVSTLRSYLGALGGEVRIVASFPGWDVDVALDPPRSAASVMRC